LILVIAVAFDIFERLCAHWGVSPFICSGMTLFSRCAVAAVILTLISTPFADLPQWTLIIPMCVGIGFGLFLCYRAGENLQMKDFRSDFWLRLRGLKSKKKNTGQIDMFEQIVPEISDRKRVFKITTTQGELFVVSADHFQDLLVTRATDDIDRATEHALGVAWKSIPVSVRPELCAILNKIVREVIKNDMRGSIVKMLSHIGENVLAELEESPEPAPQDEPFKLEAVGIARKRRR
jgi:hypothetical protein